MDMFTLCFLTIFLSALLTWLFWDSRKRQPGEPPLESGWIPFLGVAIEYGKNPLAFLRSAQRKEGTLIFISLPLGSQARFLDMQISVILGTVAITKTSIPFFVRHCKALYCIS
ncbi:hypothetical protein AGOR_G00175690 [Albula goreensis]|uniref:Cytochrome P450 n=1 Tax=Albula goreensis TaxID=1534307 RepID=A0A8T3CUU7_9TELE|nr:hypothetical protein AGOR_G00175690 [Albula goreensis]